MAPAPEPMLIEIVERVPAADDKEALENTRGYIIPNEVRLNGIPLAIPKGETIEVHGMIMPCGEREPIKVTLTVFARHVRIGAEPIERE